MKRLLFLAALLCLCTRPGMAANTRQIHTPAANNVQETTLSSAGSDTMRLLMAHWMKAFAAAHPGTDTRMEAKGSATALPNLLQGKCNLAAMSRPMGKSESALFEAKFGYRPVAVRVAMDALAVFVHPDNPLRGLTLQQLDDIFSSSRLCGGKELTDWGDLVYGSYEGHAIVPVGRNTLSGTYEMFRKTAMCGGMFKKNVLTEADSAEVVAAVAADPYAIGYAGLGYRNAKVRVLAVGRNADAGYYRYYVSSHQNDPDLTKRYAYVYQGKYPLSRMLYVYVNKAPGQPLPPTLDKFLRFALSAQGRDLVHKTGFIPLTPEMAAKESEKLAPDYSPSWWSF